MLRGLKRAAIALALISMLAIPPTVTATEHRVASSPKLIAAMGDACEDFTPDNSLHIGGSLDSPHPTAAYAQLYPASSDFFTCSNPGDWGNDSVSAWVALSPGAGSQYYGDTNAIVQVGIQRCTFISFPSVCNTNGTPHYFWAAGGCGYPPTPVDIGVAAWGGHAYVVKTFTNGLGNLEFGFWIDGTYKTGVTYDANTTSCWAYGYKRSVYAGERKDNGDSLGSARADCSFPACTLQINWMKYATGTPSGGWITTPNLTCPFDANDYDGACQHASGDPAYGTHEFIWTGGTIHR